jgi:RimJ/RimL family protein N-acetyltransferase
MTDRISTSDITVADLDTPAVERILSYWYESSAEYLQSIGVAPERLPSRRKMRELLELKVERREAAPTILVVQLRGEGIGVHELTHVQPGVSAVMHAHIWSAEHRGRGIGVVSYVKAMERFFATHGFERILFETPSANVAANRIKEALGIPPSDSGTLFLPIMTRPVETTRYAVDRASLGAIVERLEQLWARRRERSAKLA